MADLLVGEAVGGGATLGCGSAGGEHNLKPSPAKGRMKDREQLCT